MKKLFLSFLFLLPLIAVAQEKATYDEMGAGNDSVFIKVEQMPSYPGGPKALFKFLSENVHYPKAAQKKNRRTCDLSVRNRKRRFHY